MQVEIVRLTQRVSITSTSVPYGDGDRCTEGTELVFCYCAQSLFGLVRDTCNCLVSANLGSHTAFYVDLRAAGIGLAALQAQ
jgi:hypothetical protein